MFGALAWFIWNCVVGEGMAQCLPLQQIIKKIVTKESACLNFQQQETYRGCLTHDIKQRKAMEQLLLMIRASLTQ